jgi:hypothetical protein
MNPSQITLLAAREHQRELRAVAPRRRNFGVDQDRTPITRVTLRYAAAADSERLRRLAELDSGQAPRGSALVAEVDGRLRAALPLDGGPPLADPFHRGAELIALLQLRACQLAR